ncbi:MAG: RluA family pseudouridine synthase [bacterium]|nr:RluA family pseudouridine synthase [bacterium]
MIINISPEISGQRLDKFLTQHLKGLSRSQLQKLIKLEAITVNNLPATAHYQLKAGDKINIAEKNICGTANAERLSEKKLPNIKIIDETDEFIVINKPSGLAVHGRAGYTLADWLKAKYPAITEVGDEPERPGIMHRLDKDVSGLMVIAKTQASFNNLKSQFQNRIVGKEYVALVHGKILKHSGTINFPIIRASQGYKMAALPATVKGEASTLGRQAETRFQVIKKFVNYTLLKIKIITGRTHQIRVHLAAYDHPLLGDNIYATAKTRLKNKKLGLNRIFLIANRLSFTDLQNNKISFKIDLPPELKNILKTVK